MPALIHWEAEHGWCHAVDAGWTALTGQSAAEARGFGWEAAVHPDDCDRLVAAIARARATRAAFREEYRLRRRDGLYVWMLSVAAPLRLASGEDTERYRGVTVDVTGARQLEALRRTPPVPAPAYVTVPEAAAILGISAAHLYRQVRNGEADAYAARVGRTVRIRLDQLKLSLAQRP